MTENDFDMPADRLLPAYLMNDDLMLAASLKGMTNSGRLVASQDVLQL
jgi:hypothetical protein